MTFRLDEEKAILFDAAAWCGLHLDPNDPSGSLRSELLRPELVILDDRTHGHWNYQISGDAAKCVSALAARRGKLLRSSASTENRSAEVNGRILLFYPYETLCDGVAHNRSSGYFDFWNIPPWDTWLSYEKATTGRDVLYSYVPAEFIAIADRGIQANPEQCIRWGEMR